MSIFATNFLSKSVLAGASLAAALALVAFTGVAGAHADGEPGDAEFLDSAEDFVIIAYSEITETAGSEVNGDVALTPGSNQELLAGQVDGAISVGDSVALDARNDAAAAYTTIANAPVTGEITANLAGAVYLAGVYHNSVSLLLDGTMTLHGVTADDVFIFQASTETLTVMANSKVLLTGLAQACNVYWQVGSSATIGVNSDFVGTVLAYSSIAAETGADIEGRLVALNGAVTLDDNTINSQSRCVRTSTEGTVTTTTTRLNGEVDVDVVDSADTPTDETDTTGGDTTTSGGGSSTFRSSGSGRPTGLLNTGALGNTGVDYSAPIIAGSLLLLLGLGLVVVPRVASSRKN